MKRRSCLGFGKRHRWSGRVIAVRSLLDFVVLCPEHAGMPVDYALVAVPDRGSSASLFWDGAEWTPRRRLAKAYRGLDSAKAVAHGIRMPGRRFALAYFKLDPPGPKDWAPGMGR